MSRFRKSPYQKRYIFKNIDYYCWQFKYACQRFIKGYDSLDVIGVDTWFSTTLEDIMKEFIKYNIGYPQGWTFDDIKVDTPEDWDIVLTDLYDTIKKYNEMEYESKFDDADVTVNFETWLQNRTIDDINREEDLINKYREEMLRMFSMMYGHLWI